MIDMAEPDRVEQNVAGEAAPPIEVRLVGRCAEARSVLNRIRQVMGVVAARRGEGDSWPDESWWLDHLPSWFTDSFVGHTIEEILDDPNLWDFGSWVDSMKSPGWEWWSSCAEPGRWVVKVWADSWPYSIGAMEYLARVAGTDTVEVIE